MNKRKIFVRLSLAALAAALALDLKAQIPAEVKALVGTYEGSWRMFGLNDKGEVVPKMAWTDVMEGKDPVVKDGQAYVVTLDSMTFEGGIPPQKVAGREGYLLNANGSLGESFFENFGRIQIMKRLEKNVWAYSAPSSPIEIAMMGLPAGAAVTNVAVKVVGFENGAEIHMISRLTTAVWKDAQGQERRKQFVSLQGLHKRRT